MKFRLIFVPLLLILFTWCACTKEYSHELSANPAHGSLQNDTDGTCLSKVVSGLFVAGTATNSSNYKEITGNVTSSSSYFISTYKLNGFYFYMM